ncbi:hypothetical protein [Agromyces ramosus]|uniref:hypothetical protein n=1 Tax=Agromyces ramosus TaxID=33879 RepID=UPI0013EEDF4A|nr:hypothetical protein [Agromyces ramosus]
MLNEEASSVSSVVGKVSGVGVALLFLSGCASGAGAVDPGATAGAIELAVSETCAADSAPECVDVNGEYVMVPDAGFSLAGVESIAVAGDEVGNAVDVTLTSEGAAVVESAAAEAAQAGDDSRLVIKVGGEVLSAVAVAEPLEGEHFLLALPPELSAEEFTERVGRG